ncbi:TonB-dependent receptor domain-containing protein [Roseateles sp. LYH14W]|uniref:TonB-dependent receptor domain-containing protein n=1 Tax=Pelomonas parva TaxID=3299032 RepID=A0ABW7F8L8_9BURK
MRKLTNHRFPCQRGALAYAAWLCIAFGASFACAAEPAKAARYVFEQPSQRMAEALLSIARQTSTSVLFDPDAVVGRVARPVSGRLSPIEAVAAALKGTGLIAELKADGGIVVKPAPPGATLPGAPASSGPVMVPTTGRGEAAGAQEQQRPVSVSGNGVAEDSHAPSSGTTELMRVEVTGSRLRRVEAEGPAPVNVYTRQDIAKSGQPNLQRFLASLTEVSASSGEGGFSNTLGQGTVQLRGLPLGSTLVLINGRKVQAVGSSFGNVFNLNLVPVAAIERVEVVPQGSSAVYGGDALAGVVNVILKKSMNGQSFSFGAGKGRGFDDHSVSVATGRRDADSQFLLMGSYSHSSPLSMRQREFFLDADYRRMGGVDGRQGRCSPGTVRSVSGNLPGLNSGIAAIPANAGQSLTASDFLATAGTENLCNLYATGNGSALLYGYKTLSIHALGERKLFGSWSAFTEVTHVRDRMEGADRGILISGLTVPATNAFNPFGVDVRVSAALGAENGTDGLARQTNFTRALAGARGELGQGWDAEVVLSTASDRGGSQVWNDRVNSTARAAALASSDPAIALNLFTSGRAANDAVLRQIWSDSIRRSVGRKDQVSVQARGPLIDLPAGPIDVVVGAEAAHDEYNVATSEVIDVKRSSSAAYVEGRAPLLRSSNEGGSRWDLAALTLAARRDHYSDFGSANTFQGGLELRPSRNLLIRGSVATSFKPPTLVQTNYADTVYDASIFGLVDPARSDEAIAFGTVVQGRNPALMPERGQARSIGAVWEPEGGLGTRLSVTHWRTRIRDMIGVILPQTVLDAEATFPQLVTRGPTVNGQPGAVTSVKYTEVNFGRLDTAGTDLDVAYAWKTSAAKLTVSGGMSHTSRYNVQLSPGASEEDRLGRRFSDYWSPRWKGRLGVGVDQGAWSVGMTSRYLGRYLDRGTSDRRLGDYWLHDLAGTMDLKKMWPDLLPGSKAASVGVSVANLANRLPQYADRTPYYDVTQADWRGRYVTVRLSLDW